MTNEQQENKLTLDDVNAVAGKLEQFAKDLPDQEAQVLGWIIQRAAMADESDVSGYALGAVQVSPALVSTARLSSPFSRELANAAGFGRAPGGFAAGGSTIGVTWSKSF